MESFQGQVRLSVPAPVTPQFAGTVTFSKIRYKVANSIEPNSVIALGRATAATALVYCEKRGQHLLLEGADVLEEIVMQLLNEIGCTTPLQIDLVDVVARIHRWANMTLITRFRLSVPGN